jgi:integrase
MKGQKIAVEPIRKLRDVKSISKLLSDNPRDLLLFVMGIYGGLRAGDLLKLMVKDVYQLKAGDSLNINGDGVENLSH